MVIRLGILGFNEGNGHPFSFAAIVNGFDEKPMRAAGWGVIADYLVMREPEEFGIEDAVVTHVWTPDPAITEQVRSASRVPIGVEHPEDLMGEVDAVIIARDDWESHLELARPFLAAGVPTLVDKPLTLDRSELLWFQPFLEAGKLASWSGLRFAPEIDSLIERAQDPVLVRAIGIRGWDRYALHVLEPALRLARSRPVAVVPLRCGHDAVAVELEGGSLLEIDLLGDLVVPFCLEVATLEGIERRELADRFTAFRRGLAAFVRMARIGRPVVAPEETLEAVRTLIAGHCALGSGQRTVIAAEGD